MTQQSVSSGDFPGAAAAKISVIVPTYNRAEYLGQSLQSLLEQSYPCHEVIVVDDGSTDDTRAVVAGFGDRVRYVYKENGGKPAALNHVLPEITGDFVWFFDDDDVALPEANEVRLEVFRNHPGCGLVFGTRIVSRSEGPGGALVPVEHFPLDMPDGRQGFYELLLGSYFFLSSALIRAECISRVGGLNEEMARSEDYEYLLRLARVCEIRNCANYVYLFREHEGSRGSPSERHSAADRYKYFSFYERKIGEWLRSEIDLSEFEHNPERGDQRSPLLHRAAVMATKGMKDELVSDLMSAMGNDEGGRLTGREEYYSRAICEHHNYWLYIHGWAFLRSIALLRKNAFGKGVLGQLCRAYYWKLRREDAGVRDKLMLVASILYVFLLSKGF